MAEQQPTSFNITWKSGAYYVDVPNYQGGKVYTAEVVDALVAALHAALVTISNKHLGDQPAYSEVSEYVWAQQHISELRRIARHALVDFAQSGSTIPSQSRAPESDAQSLETREVQS